MICIILGTRPEIIKMCSVINACEEQNLDYFIIHTNQHYSENMDKVIFRDLGLKNVDYNLQVGSGIHGLQTGRMLGKIEDILIKRKPKIVLIQGDTNTSFAGALAASKLGIKIGHIEAGLRSHDRSMPEEINRVLTDHIADFCFAPTEYAKTNLTNEGITPEKIFITGNTVADVVLKHLPQADASTILETLNIKKGEFILSTIHRPKNVDDENSLRDIMESLIHISEKYDLPVVYPIHPRTRKMLTNFAIPTKKIITIEPVGFFDFLKLESDARIILTDSGGVQEEACILNVPCVTIRANTERQETVHIGSNILAGTEKDNIIKSTEAMFNTKKEWKNPFGDGNAGKNIIEIIKKQLLTP